MSVHLLCPGNTERTTSWCKDWCKLPGCPETQTAEKHTVSRCFTASHSWTDLYKQETELTVPQQNPKREIRDLELTGSNVLCVTVDFGVRW